MKTLFVSFFAVLLTISSAQALSFRVYVATASLPLYEQGFDPEEFEDLLIKSTLTTKQIINIARGRAINDPVPKNEILVGLYPTGSNTTEGRFSVWDKNANNGAGGALVTIAKITNFQQYVGKPDSHKGVGIGELTTQVVGHITEATVLHGASTAQQKPSPDGPAMSAGMVGLVGRFHFNKVIRDKNGNLQAPVDVNAIVIKGGFKLSGKNLRGVGFYNEN
jgi:hypothetical protein